MYKERIKIPLKDNQRMILIPLGDIQLGAREFDRPRLEALIRWIVKQDKEGALVRIIGMGDYVDPGSPSERSALMHASLHESTRMALDKIVGEQMDDAANILRPASKMILGLLTGHHNFRFQDGQTVDQALCDMLGVHWLGNGAALLRLTFSHDLELDVFAAHGTSAAQTAGGQVNARIKYSDICPSARLVFVAHDTAKFAYTRSGVDFDSGPTKRYVIGTGSFQQGYIEDKQAGYAELGGMRPSDLGIVVVNLTVEKRDSKWRLDYHVSV